MEDTYCHKDGVANDQSCGMFAIFDGHGGRHVSDHCSENVVREMQKELMKPSQTTNNGTLNSSLERVFEKIDAQSKLMDSDNCGATACVVITRKENDCEILYVANVGDTRAVLSKNGKPILLSKDHKATDQQEI